MAGSDVLTKRTWGVHTESSGAQTPFWLAVFETLNLIITDLEVLRAGMDARDVKLTADAGLSDDYTTDPNGATVDTAADMIASTLTTVELGD